jgi:hypothetical protein
MLVTFAMCAYVCIVALWQNACYLQLNRHQFQASLLDGASNAQELCVDSGEADMRWFSHHARKPAYSLTLRVGARQRTRRTAPTASASTGERRPRARKSGEVGGKGAGESKAGTSPVTTRERAGGRQPTRGRAGSVDDGHRADETPSVLACYSPVWRRWAPPSQAQCIAGAAALLAVADGRKLSCRAAGIQRGLLQSFSHMPLASRSEVTYSPGPPQCRRRSARRAATARRWHRAQVPSPGATTARWYSTRPGSATAARNSSTLATPRTSVPAPP